MSTQSQTMIEELRDLVERAEEISAPDSEFWGRLDVARSAIDDLPDLEDFMEAWRRLPDREEVEWFTSNETANAIDNFMDAWRRLPDLDDLEDKVDRILNKLAQIEDHDLDRLPEEDA